MLQRVFPATRPGHPDPPGWRLAVACEDWEGRTGIFRPYWSAHVLCGVAPPLFSAEVRARRVPLTADPAGPVRTEVTIVLRDPTGTRGHHLALYRSARRHFGMTRKRLSEDDLAFVRRVRDTADALATTREGWAPGPGGGPRTDYEGAFWTAFRTRHRMGTTPSVRALGMRWQGLTEKLDLDEDHRRAAGAFPS
jgi:hypothetical protein